MMLRNKSKWKLCFPTRLLHITFFGGFLDRKRHLIPKNLKKIDVGSAGGFGWQSFWNLWVLMICQRNIIRTRPIIARLGKQRKSEKIKKETNEMRGLRSPKSPGNLKNLRSLVSLTIGAIKWGTDMRAIYHGDDSKWKIRYNSKK